MLPEVPIEPAVPIAAALRSDWASGCSAVVELSIPGGVSSIGMLPEVPIEPDVPLDETPGARRLVDRKVEVGSVTGHLQVDGHLRARRDSVEREAVEVDVVRGRDVADGQRCWRQASAPRPRSSFGSQCCVTSTGAWFEAE